MFRLLSVLIECMPTKNNRRRYKRNCQFSKIVAEDPELYRINASDKEIEIIHKVVEDDERRRSINETYKEKSQSIYNRMLYNMRSKLQRKWDTGANEELTTQEKRVILQEFGYETT